ncbi:MAG: ATP-binding protein, partial [Oscillospiraceae bacterium]|nr:ATP-binding protein [Oscillospiraceae bacterium]
LGIVFAVCGKAPRESTGYALLTREIPPLTRARRDSFLISADAKFAENSDLLSEPGLGRLNIGGLKKLTERLALEEIAAGKTLSIDEAKKIIRRQNTRQIYGTSMMAAAGGTENLTLPPEQMDQLKKLCGFVKRREQVYVNWGFGEKIPWGRGISVLFYGAPGTGKTMAAAALSAQTGLPLMRVDISQLSSKYIGETQKNIARIFDEAAQNDCILFFDEADAIFAKRGEAADAQDKHANAETAYLLQRMEQYGGVCLLATNLLQNFDEAFRRRIGYMIHFPMPDAAMRERIWRGLFPEKAPVGDLDFAALGQYLELSGASIKNSVVHAAYLAAVHDTKITMGHILAGAKNEYAKLGKSLSPQAVQLFQA